MYQRDDTYGCQYCEYTTVMYASIKDGCPQCGSSDIWVKPGAVFMKQLRGKMREKYRDENKPS
jgi:hypothetical protein